MDYRASAEAQTDRLFEQLECRALLDGLGYDPSHATLLNGQPAQIPVVTDDFLNDEADPTGAASGGGGDADMYGDLPDLGDVWWSGNFAHMPRSDGGAQFEDAQGWADWGTDAQSDGEAIPAQLVGVNDTVWPDDAGPADQWTAGGPGDDGSGDTSSGDTGPGGDEGAVSAAPIYVAPSAAPSFLSFSQGEPAPGAPASLSLFNYSAAAAAATRASFLRA